jgi:hypothetical protein
MFQAHTRPLGVCSRQNLLPEDSRRKKKKIAQNSPSDFLAEGQATVANCFRLRPEKG